MENRSTASAGSATMTSDLSDNRAEASSEGWLERGGGGDGCGHKHKRARIRSLDRTRSGMAFPLPHVIDPPLKASLYSLEACLAEESTTRSNGEEQSAVEGVAVVELGLGCESQESNRIDEVQVISSCPGRVINMEKNHMQPRQVTGMSMQGEGGVMAVNGQSAESISREESVGASADNRTDPSTEAILRVDSDILHANSNGTSGVLMSKNAKKKLEKLTRYQLKKKERKSLEKEKRHQETERKRREWRVKFAALPTEEQEEALNERKLARKTRKDQHNEKKARVKCAMKSGVNLVLDLDFSKLMNPGEIISLSQQVMYSYAANARASRPMRLTLTGCKGEILTHLEKVSGFSNWLLHKEERSYLEVFDDRKADLVYLTADSDNLLDKLEESKTYIIGGLVDRNRWKGLTYNKAKEQGISTARLPILENLNMRASKVLTVNQVVEILLGFMESMNWTKVLAATVPQRKLPADQELNGTIVNNASPSKVFEEMKPIVRDSNNK